MFTKVIDFALDILNKLASDEGNAFRYRLIYGFCFVVHAFYALLFGLVGVTELMIFNIVSTVLYMTGLIAIKNNRFTVVWLYLLSGEIMIHSLMTSIYIGFNYQFTLYALAIIPVTYFISFLDSEIKHPFVISSVLAAINVITMIGALDISSVKLPVYEDFPLLFETSVMRINLITAVLILVSFSAMFIAKISYDLKVLRESNVTLDRLANYDQLTGLRNRNHIRAIFGEYMDSSEPYCVILGDIDDFKSVNDTYGHNAGDEVLRTVSSIISGSVGDSGVVCRWGGEEILILAKGAHKHCMELNEKILSKIRETVVESGEYNICITMTFGLCDSDDASDIEKLISLADKRLYIGKNSGKNRIVAQG